MNDSRPAPRHRSDPSGGRRSRNPSPGKTITTLLTAACLLK